MTVPYPPASGDGQDSSGLGAADLSYADVTSPAQVPDPEDQPSVEQVAVEQAPVEQAPVGPETSEQPSTGIVRTYSWPSASSRGSKVDGAGPDLNVDSPPEDEGLPTVDQSGNRDEPEAAPSIVDEIDSGTGAPGQQPEPAVPPADAERATPPADAAAPQADAEPEPTDPAVARLRTVPGRLSELDELPIEEHPARYEQLHAELTGALAQIDGAPDSQA